MFGEGFLELSHSLHDVLGLCVAVAVKRGDVRIRIARASCSQVGIEPSQIGRVDAAD